MGNNSADNGEGYVEVKFSVVIPEMADVATRSMAAPNIERLHLLIFDNNGLLSQRVNATLASTEWGETTTPTYFTAKLARSDYKRTIHLIANSPYTDVEQYPMATESQILTTLTVSGTQDAYWQRVVLKNGITGVQKTEGTGADQVVTYEPSAEVQAALTAVPLVRNHARVSVVSGLTSEQKKFDDIQFALVDIAASGTVVPYNATTGDFVNFTSATGYDALTNANYEGYEPAGREIINHTFSGGDLVFDNEGEGWVGAGGYQYLYERKQSVEPAYVLVRGKYDGASTYSYYLVDIIKTSVDENGDPQTYSYNLLRNIAYTVTITNVAGAGYATAEEAYGAGPGNNINASIKTKNLLNVSDGTSALYVEYTQKVINETGATVTLRYKYVTDLAAHQENPANGVGSDDVTFSLGAGEVIDGAIADGDATTDSDGWNTLSFTSGTCPAKNQGVKTQKLTLNAGSFSRTVEYLLVAPYTLVLDLPDNVDNALGSAVTATLTLEEGLPYGIFPLEFIIVAENNSLSPDATRNTLPVVTGVNADGTPGGQNFGYKFTLDYDQYYKLVGGVDTYTTTFPLYFKTNMADAASEGIVCSAYNPYHNIATDDLYTGVLYNLSLNPKTIALDYGANIEFDVTLRLPNNIADSDWNNGSLDFVISDSNSALELMTVVNGGKTGSSTVTVSKSTYDSGIRAITLHFKTLKKVNATTIYAENDLFRQATAVVVNNALGRLAMSLDTTTALTPGAGQTVDVTISVPNGVEAAFENDQLELLLTTSAAYLDTPVTRAVSITKLSDTQFKVVLPKSDYSNTDGTDIKLRFTTTAGNTAGSYTITVSHPYLDSSQVTIVSKLKGLTVKCVNSTSSTTHQSNVTSGNTYYLLVELEETVDTELPITLVVSDMNNTTLTYNDTKEISNGPYTVSVAAGSNACYVKLKATITDNSSSSTCSSAKYAITASVDDTYETSTLNMQGKRTGYWNNYSYSYDASVN